MSDFEKIQGTWECYDAYVPDGKNSNAIGGIKTYHGIHFRWEDLKHGMLSYVFKFRLDESQEPKTIDIYDDDGAALGIYRFDDDDTLVICMVEEPEPFRPTSFEPPPDLNSSLAYHRRIPTARHHFQEN